MENNQALVKLVTVVDTVAQEKKDEFMRAIELATAIASYRDEKGGDTNATDGKRNS